MPALEEFKRLIKQFGAIAGLAVTGSVFAPIITAASGLAPPWPNNIDFVASILMLLTMAMIFQYLPLQRSAYAKVFIGGSVLLVITLTLQVYLNMRFVTEAPNIKGRLIMGCGWTQNVLLIARTSRGFDLSSQCPGDYQPLLAMADNDPSQIWTPSSIDRVAMLLAATWVLMFVTLAVALGSFVIYNGRQRSAPNAEIKPEQR